MSDQDLNEKQKQISGLLIRVFRTIHNINTKKIKSEELLYNLKVRGHKIDGGQLRDIIGHIRRNDLCGPGFILSDNTGYWYSERVDEMEEVWESEFARAKKILKNFQPLRRRYRALKNDKNTLYNGAN